MDEGGDEIIPDGHEGDHSDQGEGWTRQRQKDMPGKAPETAAIEPGRVIKVPGDGPQEPAKEEEDDKEGGKEIADPEEVKRLVPAGRGEGRKQPRNDRSPRGEGGDNERLHGKADLGRKETLADGGADGQADFAGVFGEGAARL